MERRFETQFERVVGGTQDEKEKTVNQLNEWLHEFTYDKITPYELPKTAEDREIIQDVTAGVDRIVRSYGGATKQFPQEKMHLLEPGGIYKLTEGEYKGGMHTPLVQEVLLDRDPFDVSFAMSTAHELFHFRGYKSAQVKEGEVDLYRQGVSMVSRETDDETVFFGALEEAIVAELVEHFVDREMLTDPRYASAISKTDQLKPWFDKALRGLPEDKRRLLLKELHAIPEEDADYLLDIVRSDSLEGYRGQALEEYKAGCVGRVLHDLAKEESMAVADRRKERAQLHKILSEILEKSDGRFKNTDEIFDEFAKANFTGNIIPIARLVEGSLGKGSFSRIAQEFATIPRSKQHPNQLDEVRG